MSVDIHLEALASQKSSRFSIIKSVLNKTKKMGAVNDEGALFVTKWGPVHRSS